MNTIIRLLVILQRELNAMMKMQNASLYAGDDKTKVDKYISKLDQEFNSVLETKNENGN